MKKLFLLPFLFLLILSSQAQPSVDGDGLLSIIGSKVDAPATVSFLQINDIKQMTDAKYSASKMGIDMSASHDTMVSMTLYRDNPIYGSYAARLPKGLKFDMSSADIIKKLGKPTMAYMNSGYCEYNIGKEVMTCWFEKGVLRRVTISLQ